MSATLACRDLSVQLAGRTVLENITASIRPGVLLAIVGPNGSGKSTLLRALAGLRRPATGEVTLDGAPLHGLPRREIARRIGYLPQHTHCEFAFTVEETVAMGRHPHRGRLSPPGPRDRAAVEAALARCDLTALRGRTVDWLSGGEWQRVAVARCLAAEPEVILFDEPTAHLDLEHTLEIFERCRALASEGTAIAIATHDLASAARFADRLLVLHRGQSAADGSAEDVMTPAVCEPVFAVRPERVMAAHGPVLIFHPSSRPQAPSPKSQAASPKP